MNFGRKNFHNSKKFLVRKMIFRWIPGMLTPDHRKTMIKFH
jgi:hypothetical protein